MNGPVQIDEKLKEREVVERDDAASVTSAEGWRRREAERDAVVAMLTREPDADEVVDHPSHYTWHPTGIEAIEVIEEFPYNVGAAIGYLWRAGKKTPDPLTDLMKAEWHVRREIERVRKRANGGEE